MSEQTIFLDENDLLSLLNGGSFHTLVGNQKVVIKQSSLKPVLAPKLNYRYQIVDTKTESERLSRAVQRSINSNIGGTINDNFTN
ncbi:hypothetical protein [Staphylococcus epidermidis]|uniref:hypothetical protein n=1 Tax=Staphylococcus epidermidis TaxID=1282 RepID=UPI00194F013C|nr:hypothetical protein [Staphylococcus epidermidis]QRO69861.1 hypothetical protein I6J73_11615 [Staphylococcus epidermidis]QRS47738.1 hypothetical protein I6K93_02780 [Staphylococcus epidermidis]